MNYSCTTAGFFAKFFSMEMGCDVAMDLTHGQHSPLTLFYPEKKRDIRSQSFKMDWNNKCTNSIQLNGLQKPKNYFKISKWS